MDHVHRKYRVFWVDTHNQSDICDLDRALFAGQSILHFGCTRDGVLVVTDGMVPVQDEVPERQDKVA